MPKYYSFLLQKHYIKDKNKNKKATEESNFLKNNKYPVINSYDSK